jgi:hypothetical protein
LTGIARAVTEDGRSHVIDLNAWLSYFATDFMGDMAFGGGFELLRAGRDEGGLLSTLKRFAVYVYYLPLSFLFSLIKLLGTPSTFIFICLSHTFYASFYSPPFSPLSSSFPLFFLQLPSLAFFSSTYRNAIPLTHKTKYRGSVNKHLHTKGVASHSSRPRPPSNPLPSSNSSERDSLFSHLHDPVLPYILNPDTMHANTRRRR